MNILKQHYLSVALVLGLALGLTGCGGDSGGGVSNNDPGPNDVNVYVALGDSITAGSECNCAPYPAQLSQMIGKSVVNYGAPGSTASEGVNRCRTAITKYKPGFMLILYGVNDIIHGYGAGNATAAVNNMIQQCRNNHVVPVIATYPIPTGDHKIFAGGVKSLNSQLRDLASSQGVPLVDLAGEFGDGNGLLMPDGLHPNAAGTQVIAMAFADTL